MRLRAVGGGVRRSNPKRYKSVGAHLVAVTAVVIVAALAVGLYSSRATLERARRDVRAESISLAEVAADAVGSSIAIGRQQVEAIAANPSVPELFVDPSLCQLSFSLDLFPESRLDLVASDGNVVCSSASAAARQGVVDLGWLDQTDARGGVFESPMVTDPVTGHAAVLFAAPVVASSGQPIGAVLLVVPTADVARQLARSYGGPKHFQFALIDNDQHVLSSSLADPQRIRSDAFIDGEVPVDGTSWVSNAGISEGTGLSPARDAVVRGVLTVAVMLLVLLACFAVLSRRIVRPLRALTTAVGDTSPHADDLLAGIAGPNEIVSVSDAFRAAIAARDEYEDQLSHQALHDPLTGLPNRALLADRLGHSLEQLGRSGQSVTVLFLDLDRFKFVNDSLGHTVGDEVLTVTASRLAAVLRPGDTLARFGGDEFVVVGEGFASSGEAERFADRLLAAVATPIEAGDTIVRVTASIGVAVGSVGANGLDLV